MAFMMPVVKNDYNIYKSNRNRRVSECSNDKASSTSSATGGRRLHGGSRSAEGPSSLSTSPGSDFMVGSSPAHRSLGGMSRQSAFHHHTGSQHHGVASRNSSRNSQSSLQSPAKSSSTSSSPPPKLSSTSSLNMFHSKLVDKLRRSLTSKSKDTRRRRPARILREEDPETWPKAKITHGQYLIWPSQRKADQCPVWLHPVH